MGLEVTVKGCDRDVDAEGLLGLRSLGCEQGPEGS